MTECFPGAGGSNAGPAGKDAVFRALADENRREVLRYFQTDEAAVASVEELIDYAVEQRETPVDRDRLAVEFHHAALPHLADAGAIEYDQDRDLVSLAWEADVIDRFVPTDGNELTEK